MPLGEFIAAAQRQFHKDGMAFIRDFISLNFDFNKSAVQSLSGPNGLLEMKPVTTLA
jgi:hypothetical protein